MKQNKFTTLSILIIVSILISLSSCTKKEVMPDEPTVTELRLTFSIQPTDDSQKLMDLSVSYNQGAESQTFEFVGDYSFSEQISSFPNSIAVVAHQNLKDNQSTDQTVLLGYSYKYQIYAVYTDGSTKIVDEKSSVFNQLVRPENINSYISQYGNSTVLSFSISLNPAKTQVILK